MIVSVADATWLRTILTSVRNSWPVLGGFHCFAEGELADNFDAISSGALVLGSVNVLLHTLVGGREEIRPETHPFLLATRIRADIVTTVLMPVKELNWRGMTRCKVTVQKPSAPITFSHKCLIMNRKGG